MKTNPNAENKVDLPIEFDLLSKEEQDLLIEWCLLLDKIQNVNKKHSSYGLKHLFEHSSGGFYVNNGAFKGAMLKAGFKYSKGDPPKNWYFNVAEKSIKNEKSKQKL